MPAKHLKEVLDRFELTDGCLLRITTDNACSNYSMTRELLSTFEASGIQLPALRNHIPCMVHVIQLALGAFMSRFVVKGHTKSRKAHMRDQQFGENESTDIGKSQRLRKEGNARINKVSAMKPGLAKIFEKVRISRYFDNNETDHHIAANARCVDDVDTGSSKRVHWLSTSQSTNCSPTCYGCENSVEFDIGVAWASRPITRIHMRVAEESKSCEYCSLYTTGDEWTIIKYVMEVLRPFWYWTLWMLKRHTVTLHHVITVYDDMFDHIDGVLRALAKKNTQWKEDLYFAVKFARYKPSKYYAEVTPTTGMLRISAQILHRFRKLQSFRKWDKGMDSNPEDKTSYTIQYQDAFLKYVENEYCSKHRRLLVTKHEKLRSNNFIPSATASQCGQ